ncbi:MAG: hypothetical protein EOP84_08795 [Verrucomicrobiaceae bacterium]|nr:MAG: hypothetical protein EOP84_08795 [Verrucomicrobiaceae bacterium]
MTNKTNNREIPHHVGEIRLSGSRSPGSSRKEVIELLKSHAAEIIQEHRDIFLSAGLVLLSLHRLGHLPHVKKANGVGDVLGAKGMNLPFAVRGGKRHYLLPAVNWEPEQLDDFFQLEPAEQVRRTRQLDLELTGIERSADGTLEEGGRPLHEIIKEQAAQFVEEEEQE